MQITRRQLLMTLAAAPALMEGQGQAPPNLLFVLSDDHSAPYLGIYGADWMSTPNLDQFAREGMLFERAFTAAPQCVPSRTALDDGPLAGGGADGPLQFAAPAGHHHRAGGAADAGVTTRVCAAATSISTGQSAPPPLRRRYTKSTICARGRAASISWTSPRKARRPNCSTSSWPRRRKAARGSSGSTTTTRTIRGTPTPER